MTFATTYAIGRVAQRYYAAGRTMDGATLKQTFRRAGRRGAGAGARYRQQIEQKAATIDTPASPRWLKQV